MSDAPVQAQTPAAAATPDAQAQAPVTAPPAEPQRDQFADKLELLTKKERAIYREKQRIAQERQSLSQQKADYEKWQSAKAKAKENPLDYLTQAELSYDSLTQFMLNGGKPTPQDEIRSVRDEFESFKRQQLEEKQQQIEEQKKQQTLAQQAEATRAIDEFQTEISGFLDQNKDTYELITTRDAAEDVFATIRDQFRMSVEHWRKSGGRGPQPTPMTIKEAADLVEGFYEKEVERLTQTKKMQSKFQPQAPSQKPKGQPSPTLSNDLTSSAAPSLLPAKNEEDRMRRALAKLTGNS